MLARDENGNAPLLEMKNIVKVFSGVKALDGVNFSLRRGEVHALLGENGAGKSTMIKVLSGAYIPDGGQVYVNGEEVHISDPREGERLGIGVIYQEFTLVPHISIAENIFLGRLPLKSKVLPIVDWEKLHKNAEIILARLGYQIDPRKLVRDLKVAEQQMVEIAKAVSLNAKIIVMDEPTAPLSSQEIDRLFDVVKQFRQEERGVIYISHRMEEIFLIADRVTVLRDGQFIGTVPAEEIDQDNLIQMMVGRKITNRFPWEKRKLGKEILSTRGLTRKGVFSDINLTLYEGEILGIAGLMGSGRSELIQAIFGAYPVDNGAIIIRGTEALPKSPKSAIKKEIGYLPPDRKKDGLVLSLSIIKNVTLASLSRFVRNCFLNLRKEREVTAGYQKGLEIKTPNLNTEVMNLSGGNQQKVLLSKWLCSQATIILFDEPTRGVDVGAKNEIYNLLISLSKQGKSMIIVSSDLPELLGMCDRITVMRLGKITADLLRSEATQERVLQYMIIDNQETNAEHKQGDNNGRERAE